MFVCISPCIFLRAASLSHPLISSVCLTLQPQGMTHILNLNFTFSNFSPLLQAAAPKIARDFVYIHTAFLIIGELRYIFSVCGVITRTWEFSLPKTTSWSRHWRISIVIVECEVKRCWLDVGLGKLWASQSERLQIYYLSIILLGNIEGQEISSYKIFLYLIFDFLYLCKREWCSSSLQFKPDVYSEGCRVLLTSSSLRRKSFAFKHHTQIKFHWNLFCCADHILPFGMNLLFDSSFHPSGLT